MRLVPESNAGNLEERPPRVVDLHRLVQPEAPVSDPRGAEEKREKQEKAQEDGMPARSRRVAAGDSWPRPFREHVRILRDRMEKPQSLRIHFFLAGCQSKTWIFPLAGETRTTDCRSLPFER